jgi:maltose alpha-D-glucosyltransferase/alpha-amylase
VGVPIIDDAEHGYRQVNVANQRRDTRSLLNWTERRIRARKELPEIGWGDCTIIDTDSPHVLILRYVWGDRAVVIVHNFSADRQVVHFDVDVTDGGLLCDLFDYQHSTADSAGRHELTLDGYMHKWFRVGGPDLAARPGLG